MCSKVVVNNQGQALVELILAISIASFFLTSFVLGIVFVREAFSRASTSAEARLLLQKEVEALRSVKETAWNSFSTPGIYHVEQNGNIWEVKPNTIREGNLTHSFAVSNVCRMQATSIPVGCSSPGSISDPSTKEITVTVSWSLLGTASISSGLYLTRSFNNNILVQTSQADFDSGTHTSTTTSNNSGGEVVLAASTGGSWASPQIVSTVNLPGSQNANDIYVDGNTAYIVTGSGAGPELYIFDVSDPVNPTQVGSLNLGSTGWGIVVSNGYAYIATDSNNSELLIVNVNNTSNPVVVGSFNSPTGANGRGIAVVNNTAYLITDNNTNGAGYELYIVNVTNKTSPTQLGGLNLNAAARDIAVNGNYAYIASTHNSQELQVVNISNSSAPTLAGSYNSPGRSDGNSVHVVGTTVFMTDSRVNLLDVANPTNITLIGQPNYPGSPQAIYSTGNFAFLASTDNNGQFKVVDITNMSSPLLLGQVVTGGNGLGVFVLGDYAFFISANDNAELQIIRGGVPGNPYQPSGVFESATFDASFLVGFNYFSFNKNEPVNTSIKLQIATNNDNSSWVFVGPDGTSGTFYSSPLAIPLSEVSGRYFRFRAFFSSTGVATPILYDATINYSQ